jgi:hypothetical protein
MAHNRHGNGIRHPSAIQVTGGRALQIVKRFAGRFLNGQTSFFARSLPGSAKLFDGHCQVVGDNNDLLREAVLLVAFGVSGWRHIWLPIGVFGWFVMAHHRGEYLTGQEAGSTT